jgi:hypothetical protein
LNIFRKDDSGQPYIAIWLSDIQKSNDSLELKKLRNYLFYQIDDEIWNKRCDYKDNNNPERDLFLQTLFNNSKKEIYTPVFKHLAFCLSENGDLLSQWRGYADDGQGVSIGFKKTFFKKILELISDSDEERDITFEFKPIIYDDEEAREYICIESGIEEFSSCKNFKNESECVKNAIKNVARAAPFYKNSAFEEECEWRLVASYVSSKITPSIFSRYSNDTLRCKEIEYSASCGKLIPHVEIQSSIIKDIIAEIYIGPKCKETVDDLKHFLICMRILDDMNDDSIKIVKSKASYR